MARLAGGMRLLAAYGRRLRLAQPERRPGRVDAALDVRRLLVPGARLDLEGLHRPRVDAADRHRGDAEQGQRDARPDQVPHQRVGEHDDRDRHHDRDVGEDLLRRQQRVDVGVAGAVELGALVVLQQHRPPVQHVRDGLEQHEDRDQRAQVGPGGVGHPVADALQADPAEDVVHRQRADQGQHHGGEADAEQVAPERQLEDVEADVDAELRVLDAEVTAVAEQQPLAPPALRGQPGEEPDHRGGQRDPGAEPRAEHHPVALQGGLLHRVRTQPRPQPVGQPQVAADDQPPCRARRRGRAAAG